MYINEHILDRSITFMNLSQSHEEGTCIGCEGISQCPIKWYRDGVDDISDQSHLETCEHFIAQ